MFKVSKVEQDSTFSEPTFGFEKDGVKYRLWYKPKNYKNKDNSWHVQYQEFIRFDCEDKHQSIATGRWVDDVNLESDIDEKYFVNLEIANLNWLPLGNDCLDLSLQKQNNLNLEVTFKKEKNVQDAMLNLYGKCLYDEKAGYITAYYAFYAGQFWISNCKKYARYGSDTANLQGVSADYWVKL
jgi:hypothetical protein